MTHSPVDLPEKQTLGTRSNEDLIFHASGVHKVYQTGQVSVPALRRVDLTVWRGEMVMGLFENIYVIYWEICYYCWHFISSILRTPPNLGVIGGFVTSLKANR